MLKYAGKDLLNRLKTFVLTLTLFLSAQSVSAAATTIDGDLTLTANLDVYLNSPYTVNGNVIGGSYNVRVYANESMVVKGNMTVANLNVDAGASLIVYGDLTVTGTQLENYGNIIVLGDYNPSSTVGTRLQNEGDLVVRNNINWAGTYTVPANIGRMYVIDGTVNNQASPVTSSSVGTLSMLQSTDAALYNEYMSLAGPVCEGSVVSYSVVADNDYNGGPNDQAGDTFEWTVTGGTIISITDGTQTKTINASSGSITLGTSSSPVTITATIEWVTVGTNTITVQQNSDTGCDGSVSTFSVKVEPLPNPSDITPD